MNISEKLTVIAQNEQKVYEAGKKSQYDEFWDGYQQNGKRTDYKHAFAGAGWNDITYNPKYPIVAVGNVDYMYVYNGITKIGDIDMSKATGSLNQTFRQNANLTEIGEITLNSSITTLSTTFYANYNLTKIKKLKFGTIKTFTNTFGEVGGLSDITIDGIIAGNIYMGGCPLSKDSIISVINALSTTTSGLTITLKKTAINNAFGINVDDMSTYPEGSEFYILRNSKSNWTFSYE